MSIYKKSTATFIRISLMLGAVFLLQHITAPISYIQGLNFYSGKTPSSTRVKHTYPVHNFTEYYIIADFTGTEILTDIEINHAISNNQGDFQRLMSRVMNTLYLPLISFGILLYCFCAIKKRPEQIIPVIARSIGGHAPPQQGML